MINLNVHSHGSLLYSSAKIEQIIKRAKELNQSAIALTDYGTLCNSIYFYKEANKSGIKPILGVDFFFVDDCIEYNSQKIRNFTRLIVIAENNIGWKNLNRLVSESNNDINYFYKPRIDFNLLEKYKEGLIVLSGGLDGVIGNLLYDQIDNEGNVREVKSVIKAEALIRRFVKILGKQNFFLEVQESGNPICLDVNDSIRNLAKKYDLRVVATNNVHYVKKEDCDAHRTLLAMNNDFAVKTTTLDFSYDGYYIRNDEEIRSLSFLPEEINLTQEIADRCNISIDLKKRRLPKYQFIPSNFTAQSYLAKLANDGLVARNLQNSLEYHDRLNRELKDIHDMGFDDYFLIVHDVVSWCASQNILMGYGRGSAGGSLVSYCLGITNIDPMKYNLIWERFLNKGRGGLPDIDTDVPRSKRQGVLEYIRNRFGNANVAQIVTYNKLAARAVLKDVLKVYGVPFEEANKITSLVPIKNDDHGQIDLADAISKVPELQSYELRYKPWFAIARALEGCYKSIGTHAAAVVISDVPFNESEYPLCRSSDDKSLVFALDMQSVDTLNLLKLDILGLNTLDDIQITHELIAKNTGHSISRIEMPLDDELTFKVFEDGRTVGVFQLEKQLGKNWSKGVKPKNIEEISDLVSIIRPGPLDSGMGDEYKAVKAGDRLPNYIHPLLKSILDPTYGGCLYQEQIIEICKQLAGMSLIDADHVRKAMGKKKPEEMAKWKEVFIKGCLDTNKISRDIAENIWSFIETFAGYGFNKCGSGNLKIIRAGANQYTNKEITLSELWRYFHGDLKNTSTGKKYRNKTNPKRGLYIMSMKDGRIRPDRVNDVIQTGFKETYKLQLDSGHDGRWTLDHKFYTPNGWKALKELSIGDTVYISGEYEPTSVDKNREMSRFSNTTIEKRSYKKNTQWGKCGKENAAYIDGSFLAFKENRLNKIIEINKCEICGDKSDRYELAHLDGDHKNQDNNNLQLMCVSCHKKYDYKNNNRIRRFEKGYPIKLGTVLSISDPEIEMTYDIEMCGNEHNYIANGIVSHNSHGIGYALLAYETAYLKANYPTEFFCAKLRNATYSSDTAEEVRNIVNDAKLFNIKISPPQLSKGYITFDIIDDNTIAFGLSALKGIGEKAIIPLLKLQGQYKTFDEFLWLTQDIRINRGTIEALIQGGAFDELSIPRVQMMEKYNLFTELTDNELLVIKNEGKNWPNKLAELADDELSKKIKASGVKIPNVRRRETIRKLLSKYNAAEPFDSKMQKIAWEKYYLGIALSGNESDLFRAKDRCSDVANFASEGRRVELSIFVEATRKIKTKKGEDMAFVTGGDHTYTLDNIVVFPRQYNQYSNLLLEGAILKLRGSIDNRGSVLVDTLERIR